MTEKPFYALHLLCIGGDQLGKYQRLALALESRWLVWFQKASVTELGGTLWLS